MSTQATSYQVNREKRHFSRYVRPVRTRYQIKGLWVVRTESRVTRMGLIFGVWSGICVIQPWSSISTRYSSASDVNSSPSSTVEEKIAQYSHFTKVSRFTKDKGVELNHAERAWTSSKTSEPRHFLTSSLRCSRVSTGWLAGYGRRALERIVGLGESNTTNLL